ncbi:MAG TPA: DedA family protein [Bdellovibrionales bacterium]|nr:DedA family protein [Bdellovibrionales bacterium]
MSIKETLITTLSQLDGLTAYSAIVGLLLICGLGVPLPEDITLIAAGILASVGSISLWGAMLAGFFGVLAGDAFLYTLGRLYGRRAFQLPLIRSIMTPARIVKAERKILRNSHFICFTARFLPGLRSPIFLMSGIMGVRPLVFYGLDGLAALISVPLWVYVGFWLGENLDHTLAIAERVQIFLLIGVVFLVGGYLAFRRYRKNRRAQRLKFYMNGKYPTRNPT